MSSSSKSNTARKLAAGAYHQNIFRDERRINETIVVRDGHTHSSMKSPVASGMVSFGDALSKALVK